ncbi:hypothetical protein [Pseudomonas sp. GL-RE-19]|uniref:hypothetical protein n=1 Tax=Pseudomonas sp. GL-RE-19 TaxID=2832389 RepID=UPI001CBFC105
MRERPDSPRPVRLFLTWLFLTLSGQPTPVQYQAFPITVKTPACTTVICPPPPGVDGQWSAKSCLMAGAVSIGQLVAIFMALR